MSEAAPTPAPTRRWFRFSMLTLILLITVICVGLAIAMNSPRQTYRKIQVGMSVADVETILRERGSEMGPLNVEDVEYVEDPNAVLGTGPHKSLNWVRGGHQIRILVGRDGRVVSKYYQRFDNASALSRLLDAAGL